MSRYVPNIANNNKLKTDFIKQANSVLYKIEKGKINIHLGQDEISQIVSSIKESLLKFESSLGTGKENILPIYEEAMKTLNMFEKETKQELMTNVEESAEQLVYTVDTWTDVLNGSIEFNLDEFKAERVRWSKKQLLNRLDELQSIKDQFVDNEKRLEREIDVMEKGEEELNERILNEDNERRLNELYRKVSTLKTKKDTLNARRSNYSACFSLLDLVYSNAKEIVALSDFNPADLGKARALININKLKAVISSPEQAVTILRKMDKDVTEIAAKTKMIDERVMHINADTTTVSSDALAYKEELMRKKREKEACADISKDIKQPKETKNTIKGEK